MTSGGAKSVFNSYRDRCATTGTAKIRNRAPGYADFFLAHGSPGSQKRPLATGDRWPAGSRSVMSACSLPYVHPSGANNRDDPFFF